MSANPFVLSMLHSVASTGQEFLSSLILQELVRECEYSTTSLHQNVFSHLIRMYWIFQVPTPELSLGLGPLDQRSLELI